MSTLYRHGHWVLGVEYWVLALGAHTNFPLLSEEGGLRACADGVVPPTSNCGTILRTCPYDDHAKRWTHCLASALRLRSYYWLSGPPLLTHRCGLHHPGHSTNDCPSSERRGKFSATRARVLTTTKTSRPANESRSFHTFSSTFFMAPSSVLTNSTGRVPSMLGMLLSAPASKSMRAH